MLKLLAPKPFRGDQVAAGTVCLTLLSVLLHLRFGETWARGVLLLVAALPLVFVLAMAVPVPTDGGGPRAYLATLYICSWVLTLLTAFALADLLDASLSAKNPTWIAGVPTLLALFFSRRRDAASGTLLAGVGATVTVYAFANWIDVVGSLEATRRVLLMIAIVLALTALWQRVRGPAHGVQLLNVTGLVVLAIAVTLVIESLFGLFFGEATSFFGSADGPHAASVGWGWAALCLGTGVGLVAAGALDAERGNAVIGIANLVAFLILAEEGDLLGWPIVLALAAVVLLVIGLRPSTPLPPEPDIRDEGGPPVALRP